MTLEEQIKYEINERTMNAFGESVSSYHNGLLTFYIQSLLKQQREACAIQFELESNDIYININSFNVINNAILNAEIEVVE